MPSQPALLSAISLLVREVSYTEWQGHRTEAGVSLLLQRTPRQLRLSIRDGPTSTAVRGENAVSFQHTIRSIISEQSAVAANYIRICFTTALLAFNADINLNCLHLLTPHRTIQHHRSILTCVFGDLWRFVNRLVVVLVVQVVYVIWQNALAPRKSFDILALYKSDYYYYYY